jgi:glycosyltransferase involved in cell wall biosynthesis
VSTPRTRVVFLSHAFMIGGAEEMVLNLVRHLPDRFEPVVCCINQMGPLGEELRRTGVPFSVLGLTPGIRRPFDLVRLERHLAAIRPTIVHTFLLTASLYGRLAAMLARVPVIIGTEVNIYERKQARHVWAERLLLRGTDAVVASAESVRDFYVDQLRADPAKIDVIYNAVDWEQLATSASRDALRRTLGLPLDAPVAGIIARLTEQKGHRHLLAAVASTAALANVHLIVVGDGELRQALEDEAARHGIAARVHFLGARRDLGDLLSVMDTFVMPSLWEGLPLSLVLAMGAGLPAVATRVAGIPEVLHDGETGLLVPPGDSAALAASLTRVFSEPGLARKLGAAAAASVRPRFGVDGYVKGVSALYDRLLAAHGLA